MKTTHDQYPFTKPVAAEAIADQPSWLTRALEQAKRAGKAGLVGITSVGALMLAACNNPVQGIPEGQPPVAGSTENPGGNPSPSKNIEPTNEANNSDYEPTPLSAELSPKELAVAFYKKIDGLENSLSHPELVDKYLELDDPTEYREQLISEAVKKYADALFVKGWQNHSELDGYVRLEHTRTGQMFDNYLATAREEYTDARWRAWTEVVKAEVDSEDEDRVVVRVTCIEHDNAAEFNKHIGDGRRFDHVLTFDRLHNGEARLAEAFALKQKP